jgi:hypothetical protein
VGHEGRIFWAKRKTNIKVLCSNPFGAMVTSSFALGSFMTHVKFVIYRENKGHHTPSAINLRLSNNLGLNPACTAADNRI